MKTTFVILVAFTFLFSLACQEGNITDPVTEGSVTVNEKDNQSSKDRNAYYNRDVIKLSGFMKDPVHGSDLSETRKAEISGKVIYDYKKFSVDPAPPAPQTYVNIKLRVEAGILVQCTNGEKEWRVSKYVEDGVWIPQANETDVYLEKTFPIQNPCCHPVELVLKFRVTDEDLSLEDMHLKESNTDFIVNFN